METCRPDKPTINIFEILHLRKERYHNAMLAWLLDPDPDQNHGLDDAFLSLFLKLVGIENYIVDGSETVEPEYTLRAPDGSTRRLDIFIETGKHKIYIENKVFASSIDDQELKDQAHLLATHAGDKAVVHVFIVPRQKDIGPSTQAVVDKYGIRTLTWSELVKLLEEILVSEDDADLHVRAIWEQYLDYAKEIADMFGGFDVKEMQKYVEAAGVVWQLQQIFQLEKRESQAKQQFKGFLTTVAKEVLSQLSGVVSSKWDFRIKENRSWAPVNWGAYFTSDEHYPDIKFYIGIWYAPQDHPVDGLLRAGVGVELCSERISQLGKIVYECAKALGTVQCYEEGTYYELWEEHAVQWSDLEQWTSFRDRLVDRAVAWMTALIPVIEKTLQPLQKEQRAKKRSTAPR
jgi:hypothetical protein